MKAQSILGRSLITLEVRKHSDGVAALLMPGSYFENQDIAEARVTLRRSVFNCAHQAGRRPDTNGIHVEKHSDFQA